MDITAAAATLHPPDERTPAQIDRELAEIADDLAQVTDPVVAAALVTRRQALLNERPVAVATERALERHKQRASEQEAREGFAALEAELGPEFRAAAAALDEWVATGQAVMDRHRALVRRLREFTPFLRQGPAPAPGHELDLPMRLEKLSLSLLVERELAKVGVLDHVQVPGSVRDPEFRFETYVTHQLQRFLEVARMRLPPVTGTEQESTQQGAQP
jgi:hypothetical protein